jgi:hypothetical protein
MVIGLVRYETSKANDKPRNGPDTTARFVLGQISPID